MEGSTLTPNFDFIFNGENEFYIDNASKLDLVAGGIEEGSKLTILKSDEVILKQHQIDNISRCADIVRGDYGMARDVQYWIHDALEGKNITKELDDYEE